MTSTGGGILSCSSATTTTPCSRSRSSSSNSDKNKEDGAFWSPPSVVTVDLWVNGSGSGSGDSGGIVSSPAIPNHEVKDEQEEYKQEEHHQNNNAIHESPVPVSLPPIPSWTNTIIRIQKPNDKNNNHNESHQPLPGPTAVTTTTTTAAATTTTTTLSPFLLLPDHVGHHHTDEKIMNGGTYTTVFIRPRPEEQEGEQEEQSFTQIKEMSLCANPSSSTTSSTLFSWPVLPASQQSQRTRNPIRAVVDPILASRRCHSRPPPPPSLSDPHHHHPVSSSSSSSSFSLLTTANAQQQPGKNEPKEFISLALGDPTSSGNFNPCPWMQQQGDMCNTDDTVAVAAAWQNRIQQSAGYVDALGTESLRQVIAEFHSTWHLNSTTTTTISRAVDPTEMAMLCIPPRIVDASHVVVASGCSGALDLVLRALLDPGTYLLVPNPGFPLYQVICESIGAHVLPYRLLPDQEWEIDLDHVRTLVQTTTTLSQGGKDIQRRQLIRGMVVNNPSNPTGAVYRWQHLQDIVALCEEFHLPIICDEIYGDLTFLPSRPFIPIANVTAAATTTTTTTPLPGDDAPASSRVPVITCSGLGKQFLVPGWRVGWAIFYDNIHHSLAPIEQGVKQLAQITLGASHLAQILAVEILSQSLKLEPLSRKMVQQQEWQRELRQTLWNNAQLVQRELAMAPGLELFPAQGAMYMMVCLKKDDPFDFLTLTTTSTTAGEQFSQHLLDEENVFVLPGSCFGIPNAFRLVFCAPAATLQDATQRIVQFCQRHYKKTPGGDPPPLLRTTTTPE